MFGCNALMWTLFVKALQKCASSLEATITNTSSNLLFTVRFHEKKRSEFALWSIVFAACDKWMLVCRLRSLPCSNRPWTRCKKSVFQAFFGKVLFGEALSLMWWFGAILIIIGLALVHTDTHQNEKEKDS